MKNRLIGFLGLSASLMLSCGGGLTAEPSKETVNTEGQNEGQSSHGAQGGVGESGGGAPPSSGGSGGADSGATGGQAPVGRSASGGSTPSGGRSGSGGAGSGGSAPTETAEFVISIPRAAAFGLGNPLVATPRGTVLTSGMVAPDSWLPESPDAGFLAEISPSGELLHTLAFDEALRPTLIAVDQQGSVFTMGGLLSESTTQIGSFELTTTDYADYLLKLSPDLVVIAAVVVPWNDRLSAMTVDPSGDLIIATSFTTFVDAASIERPRVTKFSGSNLEELWSEQHDHDDSQAYHRAITTLADGTAVTTGAFHGTLTIGETLLPKLGDMERADVSSGWLTWLDTQDGKPQRAFAFGGLESHYGHGLQTTSTSLIRLLSSHHGEATLFGQETDYPEGAATVTELNAAGELQWMTPLGGSDIFAHAIAQGAEDQTYAVGRRGRWDDEPSHITSVLLRVEADGTLGPSVDFDNGNVNGASTIAVDTHGGVWISGAWETPFEFAGKTQEPDADGCQFILRKEFF